MLPPSKAGQMTQIGVLEYLKLENVTLSNQLTETQHRSIKEKERIAVQLQSIEVFKKKKNLLKKEIYLCPTVLTFLFCLRQTDMLTQEAAYKQIQDAKTMVEDDLQRKLDEFEEEQERLTKLANTASSLERELEQVISLV